MQLINLYAVWIGIFLGFLARCWMKTKYLEKVLIAGISALDKR